MLQFLPFLKEIGATGLLIEWEDTFPYTRDLMQIGGLSNSAQATGAPYTIEEAKQLLNIGNKLMCIFNYCVRGHVKSIEN